MMEWTIWGFGFGLKIFGAVAGIILGIIAASLLSLLVLMGSIELISRVSRWIANILGRRAK